MALLALDDTDTLAGGCTTHTAFRLALALQRAEGTLAPWGLLAPPRLVRLCPAIRDKTRGNGALVLPVGRVDRDAPGIPIGRARDGTPIAIFPEADPAPPTPDEHTALHTLVADRLPAAADDRADPQPAALLLPRPPDPVLYQEAVARRVTGQEAWSAAPDDTIALTPRGRRGEVGALAAAAWRPEPARMTWEAIGYRPHDTDRILPSGFAETLATLPDGFDNVAAASGRLRAVPRTPCPVRFGVRGLDPQALRSALWSAWCDDSGAGGWLLATNHARGDHLHHARTALGTERVVRLDVVVRDAPRIVRGGHVLVAATSAHGTVTLAAYEPTKGLARTARGLSPGDALTVYGRADLDPHVLALEAFQVRALVPRHGRRPNPRCPSCGAGMKSHGREAGYRCRPCHTRAAEREDPIVPPAAGLHDGAWVQVPDHVRGHLLPPVGGLPPARPLMRQDPILLARA